jgi:hypothetical protein
MDVEFEASAHGTALYAALCWAAPFTEVLLLDTDSHPVSDPRVLFSTAEWRSSGNLFFASVIPGGLNMFPPKDTQAGTGVRVCAFLLQILHVLSRRCISC